MKPYGLWRILIKLLAYRFRAKSKHGVHSPFVFQLVTDALSKRQSPKQHDIEHVRSELRSDKQPIRFQDFGKDGVWKETTVGHIARMSLKPRKYAELIANIAQYFKVRNSIELGTSLGITTAYLSRNTSHKVYTFEGGKEVSDLAQRSWNKLGCKGIELYTGAFSETLRQLPKELKADLIFVDGHHQKEPTLQYFEQLKAHSHKDTVFIFDDIHWSKDMEEAWELICDQPAVTTSIDLFFVGLVFLKPELSKEHFELKY